MKVVFEGEILNVVATKSSMVIAYVVNKNEEKMLVSYKMISFDNGEFNSVPSSEPYDLAKFGTGYKKILPYIENHIMVKSVILPNGKTFTLDNGGRATLFDQNGEPIWQGEIEFEGEHPSSLAISPHHVWVGFQSKGLIMRLNMKTLGRELRLGGEESILKNICDIFWDDGYIYICCSESSDILRLETKTYNLETYHSFNRCAKQFLKAGGYEFAVLDSGVYLLN